MPRQRVRCILNQTNELTAKRTRVSRRPTHHQLRLINTVASILDDPSPQHQDLVFMARELVQITLPHSDPGNVPIWTRRNGNQILSIRPGIWRGEVIGYPYGTVPRLLLFWLTTETIRTQSKRLHLGDSLAPFMRELDLDPGRGGKRSDYSRVRKQTERFFRAVYTNEFIKDTKTRNSTTWRDIQVAPEGELWWDYDGSDNVFDGWIELSDQAYEMFVSSPVPIDVRVLRAIKNSSLALDLYVWTTYKTFVANIKDKPQQVPWRGLIKQLGSAYGDPNNLTKSDVSNFRRKAKAVFALIEKIAPSLDVRFYNGGVEIFPAELAVQRRPRLVSSE